MDADRPLRPLARAGACALLSLTVLLTGAVAGAAERVYRLGAGDRVQVTVFGHPDLSGEFQVDGGGRLSLPLAGSVTVRGRSIAQSEAAIADALSPDYLRDPRVSVQVMNYRPFYIIGEVKNPGSYPYVSEMDVLTAVAVAGGYSTERARSGRAVITRAGQRGEPLQADGGSAVLPGDIVEILERRF